MADCTKGEVWLVTGASSGLGLAVALCASRNGHTVIACTRAPEQAAHRHSEIEQSGGWWAKLDVSDQGAADTVRMLVEKAGGVNVVVNCAGCIGPFGATEDIDEEAFHQVMNTNFYGPMRLVRGVLPAMRRNRSGTIVQVSSTAGVVGSPANNPYCSSKFALEGFSESLAHEVNPFGIRVVIVEPGMFRTGIMYKGEIVPASPAYQVPAARDALGWVERVKVKLNDRAAVMGDPSQFGQRVVDIVARIGLGIDVVGLLRIPLGSDAWAMCKQKGVELLMQATITKDIAYSTDSDALNS